MILISEELTAAGVPESLYFLNISFSFSFSSLFLLVIKDNSTWSNQNCPTFASYILQIHLSFWLPFVFQKTTMHRYIIWEPWTDNAVQCLKVRNVCRWYYSETVKSKLKQPWYKNLNIYSTTVQYSRYIKFARLYQWYW